MFVLRAVLHTFDITQNVAWYSAISSRENNLAPTQSVRLTAAENLRRQSIILVHAILLIQLLLLSEGERKMF